ncbi:uncharacterized protein FA14DRAFT_162367 [Meira miltonrushii]|uniref:SET domain-containing protein n=1 Tax=Meira miltonrushii TaxID=1280837 RepID=A0A316V4D7_9BASI|nr:uncharacterized protein FA14DRAFT_162367 [Meira miltonrushii]PWN32114.1 hypothetical protein FA14DRAFT_162367 [Meira miltonrushii]
MEDIATDDDLLSDMLLDSLEFEPKISTHKMNQAYRSPRYKTQQIIDIVRQKIVIDADLAGAVETLCSIDVIRKHLSTKSSRQRYEFQQHAKRYLETYMPESGVEFALTTRYKRASRMTSSSAETSKAGQEHAEAEARALAAGQAASQSSVARGKLRAENGESLGTSMADLCVVATKPFKAGDLVIMCKGGVKDLTKTEDDALREEAALSRERRKEQQYGGVLGPGRDFSVIRSARKGCSQLLLGPARFVNHDCDPNCEFHRLGQSQMVFRCLRDVGLNEEITTYYGDNYFEVGNAECMCRTCESRGEGIFASQKKTIEQGESEILAKSAMPSVVDTQDAQTNVTTKAAPRRSSSRKGKSPPPKAVKKEPTTMQIEKNGKVIQKTFPHHVSDREFDPLSSTHIGPKCTCLTCGSAFWAPEAWWLPDECRRCERHFKIYQGDWPGRTPTEPKWSAIYTERKSKREKVDAENKKRKLLDTASPGLSGTSDVETPVKLSPMRDVTEPDGQVKVNNTKRRTSQSNADSNGRKKKSKLAPESSDNEVEESIKSLIRPAKTSRPSVKRIASDEEVPVINAANAAADDEDDEMSDLTSVSATNEGAMSRTASSAASNESSSASDDRPCGPKMLGKHAKTETLAMFWGAPTGDKRARKPRANGLESLSDTVKVAGNGRHRRTASDMSNASTWTANRENELIRSPPDAPMRSVSDIHAKFPNYSEVESGPSLGQHSQSETSIPKFNSQKEIANNAMNTDEQNLSARSTPSSSAQTSSLATHGPQRTSVKNLAMAWGAGVEEGGRGNRKRTPRDVGSPLALMSSSSPKHAKDERSATPPSVKASGQRQIAEEGRRLSESNISSTIATAPSTDSISSNPTPNNVMPKQLLSNATNDNQAPSPPLSDRSVSPARSISGSPAGSAAARNASPLAGPPPVTFNGRPGVVPGQPIRKNLRWGSGKVSMSRPMVGSASSPLAGPGASSSFSMNRGTPLSTVGSASSPLVNSKGPTEGLQTPPTIPSNPSTVPQKAVPEPQLASNIIKQEEERTTYQPAIPEAVPSQEAVMRQPQSGETTAIKSIAAPNDVRMKEEGLDTKLASKDETNDGNVQIDAYQHNLQNGH